MTKNEHYGQPTANVTSAESITDSYANPLQDPADINHGDDNNGDPMPGLASPIDQPYPDIRILKQQPREVPNDGDTEANDETNEGGETDHGEDIGDTNSVDDANIDTNSD